MYTAAQIKVLQIMSIYSESFGLGNLFGGRVNGTEYSSGSCLHPHMLAPSRGQKQGGHAISKEQGERGGHK